MHRVKFIVAYLSKKKYNGYSSKKLWKTNERQKTKQAKANYFISRHEHEHKF